MKRLNPKEVIRKMRAERVDELTAISEMHSKIKGESSYKKQRMEVRACALSLELPFKSDTQSISQALFKNGKSKGPSRRSTQLTIAKAVARWTEAIPYVKQQNYKQIKNHRRWAVNRLQKHGLLCTKTLVGDMQVDIPVTDFFSVHDPQRISDQIDCQEGKPRTIMALQTAWGQIVNLIAKFAFSGSGRYLFRRMSNPVFLKRKRYNVDVFDLFKALQELELNALRERSGWRNRLLDLILTRLLVYASIASMFDGNKYKAVTIADLPKIEWTDIDFKKQSILVGEVLVSVPKIFLELLRAYRGRSRRKEMLAKTDGYPIGREWLTNRLRVIYKRLGLSKTTPESILKQLPRCLVDIGIPVEIVTRLPKR